MCKDTLDIPESVASGMRATAIGDLSPNAKGTHDQRRPLELHRPNIVHSNIINLVPFLEKNFF